jgi:hypothetical protein
MPPSGAYGGRTERAFLLNPLNARSGQECLPDRGDRGGEQGRGDAGPAAAGGSFRGGDRPEDHERDTSRRVSGRLPRRPSSAERRGFVPGRSARVRRASCPERDPCGLALSADQGRPTRPRSEHTDGAPDPWAAHTTSPSPPKRVVGAPWDPDHVGLSDARRPGRSPPPTSPLPSLPRGGCALPNDATRGGGGPRAPPQLTGRREPPPDPARRRARLPEPPRIPLPLPSACPRPPAPGHQQARRRKARRLPLARAPADGRTR